MGNSETRNFAKPMETVFTAAVKAVRDLGYKIDSLDKANGLINFKTGMSWKSWAGQEMSVLLLDEGGGTCSVDIAGKRSQTGVILQVADWGEKASIAKKVFEAMGKYIT
jgi:hypothetical protein